MRRAEDFSATVRAGTKGRSRRVLVHLATHEGARNTTLVGFVVPKTVGTAVTRNLVKRRLRGALAERLCSLPVGAGVVVRALPASAEASYAELCTDLDKALAHARARRRQI